MPPGIRGRRIIEFDPDMLEPEFEGVIAAQIRDAIFDVELALRPARASCPRDSQTGDDAGGGAPATAAAAAGEIYNWKTAKRGIGHARRQAVSIRPGIADAVDSNLRGYRTLYCPPNRP